MGQRVEIAAVWMPEDAQRAGAVMTEFGPLFVEHWEQARPPGYPEFAFDIESFIRGWKARTLLLVAARVDGVLVGFSLVAMTGNYFCRTKGARVLCAYARKGYARHKLWRQGLGYLRQLLQALNLDTADVERARGLRRIYTK